MVKKMKKRKNTKIKSFGNINEIKKKIKNELYSQYNTKEEKKNHNIINTNFEQKTPEEEEREYLNLYKQYMKEEFNPTIVNMFIIFLNKNMPIEYQNESNFINKFINLMKILLLNEIELSCFTLLIDEMGWSYPDATPWTYFSALGIYSKKICGKEEESILLTNIYDRKENDFILNYANITSEEKITNFVENLSVQIINERFKQLNKFINSYCRKNYINYNGVVDKIVKMSQPYGEESNGNQLYKDEVEKDNNIGINNNNISNNNFVDGLGVGDYKGNNNLLPDVKKNNIKNNENNLIQPTFSNYLFEQTKSFTNFQYNPYNRDTFFDYNNQNLNYMPSLNPFRMSSQPSFKLMNNPSNSNLSKY
jgi:hypothetical protein